MWKRRPFIVTLHLYNNMKSSCLNANLLTVSVTLRVACGGFDFGTGLIPVELSLSHRGAETKFAVIRIAVVCVSPPLPFVIADSFARVISSSSRFHATQGDRGYLLKNAINLWNKVAHFGTDGNLFRHLFFLH